MKLPPILLASTLLVPLSFVSCGGGEPVEPGKKDLAQCDEWIGNGDYDEVVAMLGPRFEAGETNNAEVLRLAVARELQGEVPKAVKVLQGALERDPKAIRLSQRLASIYRGLRLPEKALGVLEDARAAGGQDAELALEMAVLRGILEDFDGAEEELQRARAAGAPELDVDFNQAILLDSRGDLKGAEELLSGIVAGAEAPPHVVRELCRIRLARAPQDADRAREARDSITVVLDLKPEDWRAWEILGDCEMVLGDAQAAQVYYTHALKHGQNPPRVEDKYRAAALATQALLEEAGVLTPEPKRGAPPIPQSVIERQRAAREKLEQAEKGAGGSGKDGDF